MPSLERTKAELEPLLNAIKDREVLQSWGEIAAFIGCSISFVRRSWKFRGLPVVYLSPKKVRTTKSIIRSWLQTRADMQNINISLDRALYSEASRRLGPHETHRTIYETIQYALRR